MFSSSRDGTVNRWKKYSCQNKSKDEKLADLLDASRAGKEKIIQMLITKGHVDVNEISDKEQEGQGLTALHLAVRHNHVNCVKLLLESGADVNATDNFGFRPIHDATLYGNVECLKELLNNGAFVKGVELHGLDYVTPLYYAVKHNYLDCIQVLEVDKAFDSDECDHLIWQLGSTNRNINLLSYSKKKEFTEKETEQWLRNSAVAGNEDYLKNIVELYRNKNQSEEFHRKHGFLLIIATQHGHRKYLEDLLDRNFDSNEANKSKSSALHYAARYGHTDIIELLVNRGAVLNAKNLDNWTPLHVALKQCNTEAVAQLIKCGCDINLTGGDFNDTPLHLAVKLPVDPDTLKELLAAKPSAAVKNDKGQLPTDVIKKDDCLYEVLMEYVRN